MYSSSLTSVAIGNSVTRIAGAAFHECINLTSVTIPDSVTSIGELVFEDCSGMTTLTVKATTPPTFGSDMLYGYSALTSILVPAESVDTYKAADGWSSYASKISAIPTEP